MSPFPARMTDRWENRTEADPGHGTVYWHMLVGDNPQLVNAAKVAQGRLARFGGLHMTPHERLHITALIAGTTDDISVEQMTVMISEAQARLSSVRPIPVTIGHVLYHSEAIMLAIEPREALSPILEAAHHATRRATGKDGIVGQPRAPWTPHITVSYSTASQPAGPIIAALGRRVPRCEVLVGSVNLVIQWGPERLWDWESVGTISLGQTMRAAASEDSQK